ncbi:hypothetical protein GCM10009123_13140 [Kangiella japonica]|uniref:Sel1 repeat family protein n=1 Tax=Kangiella japonica TaxID=647384 RepID=A0ABN0SYV9_9GAMM
MTNKIIIGLALCVVGLFYLAVSLWSENDTLAEQSPEIISQQKVSLAQKDKETATSELSVTSTVKEKEAEQKENVVQEDVAETKEVCQLANQYNDWYHLGNSYESTAFIAEVKAWAGTRGYFETEYSRGSLDVKKRSDYDYYALEDLEEMAEAGDSMANVRLAYRLYLKGDKKSLQKAQPYCNRAIADGYTALIMCKTANLVYDISELDQQDKTELNRKNKERLELEFLAWQGVAERLGDELGAELAVSIMPEQEFEFDTASVQQKTTELVDNIQSYRKHLGIEDIQQPPMPKLLAYLLKNPENIQEDINACFE